jgi:hypothetical protein
MGCPSQPANFSSKKIPRSLVFWQKMIKYICAGMFSLIIDQVTGRRLQAAPGEGWVDLQAELHGHLLWP